MIPSFRQWPIRYKILLLVAAPLMITATLITGYHTAVSFEQDKNSIRSSAERLLNQAANAGQLAFFAEDTRSLNNLAKGLMIDTEISSVHFFDEEKTPIPHDFNPSPRISLAPFSDGDNFQEGDEWFFVKAVHYTEESFSDDPEQELQGAGTSDLDARPIGWITIAIDLSQSRDKQRKFLVNNLAITLTTTVIALWMGILFSRTITSPLRKITQAVHHYSDHDFDHRLPEISGAELGQLEQGINHLATEVSESQQTLEKAIDRVRSQWIEAVEDLELKNEDLISAKIHAEEANKAKDDFLARMSHELRTPLTAIMGFAGILERTEQPQTRREYTEMILATSTVLLSTINDILDFSKLKSNTFKLNPSHFNLEHLLRNILDMHSVSAHQKGIELNLMIDSDVPMEIEVDFDKLKKVLSNVVANAIKFTDDGDIVVFVSNAQDQHGQPLIAIEVKDSGLGIEPGELNHLFDPFYQTDESSTRQHEGTGLGLSIAKDFVELMGGTIQLDSEPGEGTEVRFTFAFTKAPFDEPAPTVRSEVSTYLFDTNPWTKRAWRNMLLKISRQVYAPHNFDDLLEVLPLETGESLLLMGHDLYRSDEAKLEQRLKELRNVYQGPVVLAVAENGDLDKAPYEEIYAPLIVTRKPFTQSRLGWAMNQIEQITTQATKTSSNNSEGERQPDAVAQSDTLLPPLHILLAEDNPFNQRLFKDLLQAAGARVEVASDGALALQASQATAFDLLILDLHMPKMDGTELSKHIRKTDNPNSGTPIMLLTADILSHQKDNLDSLGVNAICHKPIDESRFMETIKTLCQNSSLAPTKEKSLLRLAPEELTEEVERQLVIIKKALSDRDLATLKDQAHQLAGIIGLSKLTHLDSAMQQVTKAIEMEAWEEIDASVDALRLQWQQKKASGR